MPFMGCHGVPWAVAGGERQLLVEGGDPISLNEQATASSLCLQEPLDICCDGGRPTWDL